MLELKGVRDFWSEKQLRDEFNLHCATAPDQYLVQGDRLVFRSARRPAGGASAAAAAHSDMHTEEVELEEGKELYKYPNMGDRAEILIKREDMGQAAVKYICAGHTAHLCSPLQPPEQRLTVGSACVVADCGEEVRLKKSDEVRCRQCGYRIVYKKRTTQRLRLLLPLCRLLSCVPHRCALCVAACQYLAR